MFPSIRSCKATGVPVIMRKPQSLNLSRLRVRRHADETILQEREHAWCSSPAKRNKMCGADTCGNNCQVSPWFPMSKHAPIQEYSPYFMNPDKHDSNHVCGVEKNNGKWFFLHNQGPVMPEPYQQLPAHVKLLYKGEEVDLSLPSEEHAVMFAKVQHQLLAQDKIFKSNFFNDWRKYMTNEERNIIQDFDKCDFSCIILHLTLQKKNKHLQAMLAEKRKEYRYKHGWCIIDNACVPVSDCFMEKPGLFMSHGMDRGKIRHRVLPASVTINCSKNSVKPVPPSGQFNFVHDSNKLYLVSWYSNNDSKVKYLYPDNVLKARQEREEQKFNCARKLAKNMPKIRRRYAADYESQDVIKRQISTAMYLLDTLSLRIGGESITSNQDSVGTCSLRVRHIKLKKVNGNEPNVTLVFVGKASVPFSRTFHVEDRIYSNLADFIDKKKPHDRIFHLINSKTMNAYLQNMSPGITAKVFRTCHASCKFEELLANMPSRLAAPLEKMTYYSRALEEVAFLCNHFKCVGHETSAKSTSSNENDHESGESDSDDMADQDVEFVNDGNTSLCNFERRKIVITNNVPVIHREKFKSNSITSKLNYIDPRISISWCIRQGLPIEIVYTKRQATRFTWAVKSASADFHFDTSKGEFLD